MEVFQETWSENVRRYPHISIISCLPALYNGQSLTPTSSVTSPNNYEHLISDMVGQRFLETSSHPYRNLEGTSGIFDLFVALEEKSGGYQNRFILC